MDKQYTDLGDEILYKGANLFELTKGELTEYSFFVVNITTDKNTGIEFGDVIQISEGMSKFEELEAKYREEATMVCRGRHLLREEQKRTVRQIIEMMNEEDYKLHAEKEFRELEARIADDDEALELYAEELREKIKKLEAQPKDKFKSNIFE